MISFSRLVAAPALKAVALTTLLAGISACSGGNVSKLELPEGEHLLPSGSNTVVPLFDLMEGALFETAFHGTRTVSLFIGQDPVTFSEDIAGDGAGNLYYNSHDVLQPHPDPDLFEILLDERSRFAMLYRDPRIREVDLFTANYLVIDMGTNPVVAGVPCIRLHVSRVDATPFEPHWEMSVDPVNGMTMAWDELSFAGVLLAQSEYTTFTETFDEVADTVNLELVEAKLTHTALNHRKPLDRQLSHPVLEPTSIPAGFQLTYADVSVFDEGLVHEEYIRQEYTDGLEFIVLLHKEPIAFSRVPEGRVMTEPFGAWTFLTGEVNGFEIILASRIRETKLLLLLASSY